MAEDKKLDSLLERVYQDGVEKSNKKAEEIISNAKSEADKILKDAEVKSEEIIKEAERKAEELKKNTITDVRMAGGQSISVLKQKIKELVSASVLEDGLKGAFADTNFLKDLILEVVKKWDVSSGDVAIYFPESKKGDIDSAFEKSIKSAIKNATINFDKKLSNGFRIVPDGGNYQMQFTDEDCTLNIFEEYAKRDPRIRVMHHEKNMGSFAARYTGIMEASGDYTIFIDPDDELLENACECLSVEVARQKKDVLQFGVVVKAETGKSVPLSTLEGIRKRMKVPSSTFFEKNFEKGELLKTCYIDSVIPFNVWNKIYRTDILKKAHSQYKGERVLMADDCLKTFMILCYTQSYGVCSTPFYIYYVGGGMSTEVGSLSEKKMQRTAEEYQVYTLAKTWVKQTGVPARYALASLQKIHTMVSDAIFWYFFHETTAENYKHFHKYLAQYYPTDEFVRDVTSYVFEHNRLNQEDMALRLKGYPAFCDYSRIKQVRTVGMFYYRLHNGGIERVISLLAPILESCGYRVVLITDQRQNEETYELPESVILASLGTRDIKSTDRMNRFRQIIEKNNIDIMIYHAWLSDTIVYDALAIKSLSIPLVLHTHSKATVAFEWAYSVWNNQRAVYALFDKVLALTKTDQAWWAALGFDAVQILNPPTYPIQSISVAPKENHNCVWLGRLNKVDDVIDPEFFKPRQI